MDIGTPYGLALASGIDAYIPLLSFAISVRFFHLFKLNPNFSFITQDWFLSILVILAIADLIADKIPVVDHIWDAIHTVIRPIAGAIVAAAASGTQVPHALLGQSSINLGAIVAATASGSQASDIGLPIALILGGILAGMAHTTKTATRLASTATTAGIANVGLSIAEDVMVVIATLLSLFVPVVMVVVIALFVIIFLIVVPRLFRMLRRGWRRLSRRGGTP